MDLFNNDLGIKAYKKMSATLASMPAYNPGPKLALIANTILQKITEGMGVRLAPENVPEGTFQVFMSTDETGLCN